MLTKKIEAVKTPIVVFSSDAVIVVLGVRSWPPALLELAPDARQKGGDDEPDEEESGGEAPNLLLRHLTKFLHKAVAPAPLHTPRPKTNVKNVFV